MLNMKYIAGVLSAMALVLALSLTLVPQQAMADPLTPATVNGTGEECTDFAGLAQQATDGTPGILTNILGFIKPVVNGASQKLFQAFTSNSGYQMAVDAAASLMIVIYGVSFTMGIVQPSFAQAFVRLMKLAIIYAVVSPGGWAFFNEYAVTFFNDGTDELIGGVMKIGTGIPFTPGDSPFKALDGIAKIMVSPDMIIAVIGATTSGVFGLSMGALLVVAIIGLLKLLIEALKIYAISFIVRAMLLGVAPIFIVFLLFDKTKQMFTGWLNSLINLSLKPILYFTFISFFLVMMQQSSKDMLGGAELCWTVTAGVEGTPNKMSGWKFKMPGQSNPNVGESDWKGPVDCQLNGTGKVNGQCPSFPINILDILSFVILVYVAQKFAGVVDQLANDIASVAINLSTDTKQLLNAEQKSEGGGLQKNPGVPDAKYGNPPPAAQSKTVARPGGSEKPPGSH